MITKMKKMTFLVWHNAYAAFLEKLRTAGVLHVSRLGSADAEDEALGQSLAAVRGIEQIIQQVKERCSIAEKLGVSPSGKTLKPDAVPDMYNNLVQENQVLAQNISQCQKEIAALEPWGDFDPSIIARLAETSIREVSPNIIEMAQSMGASPIQIITKVLIPEAVPSLLSNATTAITTILSYTAMSGIIGGGGLGKIAINYGYYRYK